ncbi:hypothetical protein Godav_028386, partial [Gossypium davidsonii]|nr:hypothetical protein [Gossypium davidsonii]
MSSVLPDEVVDSRFFSTKEINVLLHDHNYLLWRQQVLLAVKHISFRKFARFEQQDSALASWLLSSVSATVLPHLIGLDTSLQIWSALVRLFGSKTTSQLMFYRRALHSQRKVDLSMKEFLMKVKGYCDSLASCGETISEREHVTAILSGLSSAYESVLTIITASSIPYSVQSVSTMLLDAEAQQLIMSDAPRARGSGRDRSSGSRFQCQLYGKTGHLVDRKEKRKVDSEARDSRKRLTGKSYHSQSKRSKEYHNHSIASVGYLDRARGKHYAGSKTQATFVASVGSVNDCQQCELRHFDECRAKDGACFKCGLLKHFICDCPKISENEKVQNVRTNNTATRGRPPHNPRNVSASRGVTKDSTVRSKARALTMAYAIRAHEEASAPDVITGTFSIVDTDVIALIDSGSTHSYVCTKLVS